MAYTEQVALVQGAPAVRMEQKALERRVGLLESLEASFMEKHTQVEAYIQQIEKSELRAMFRFYFIDDLSYPKVAVQMNQMFPKRRIKYTDENIRKR